MFSIRRSIFGLRTILICLFVASTILLVFQYNNPACEMDHLKHIGQEHLNMSMPVCAKEVKDIMFLKMHKAGSSTLQNIFLRFALARDLNLVLLNHFKGSYHIIGRNVVRDRLIPIRENETYNILCNHIVYNRQELTKIMPGYAMNITIVREPTSHFISSGIYFGFFYKMKKVNGKESSEDAILLDYINMPQKYVNVSTMLVHNLQSLDLGLNPQDFFDTVKIEEMIKMADSDFQLVMLMEYFDESLILMKRYLCWEMRDIIYSPNNVGKIKLNITENNNIVSWLHKWNRADYMLYEHFQIKFWQHVYAEGQDFFLEVQHFKKVLQDVWNFCRNRGKAKLTIEVSVWNSEFELLKYHCEYILLDERSFVRVMMLRAANKVNITLPQN